VATGPQSAVGVGMGRMDMRNGAPTGGYSSMPEPVHTNGGFHPSDAGQHDRR